MNTEFSTGELLLIDMLLSKEKAETRVEIHHCRNHEYREYLKDREKQIGVLMRKIKDSFLIDEHPITV